MQVRALQPYACMPPGRACCSWPRARHARRRAPEGGRPFAALPLPGGRPAHLPLLIVLLEPTAARRALRHCAPAVPAADQLEPASPGPHCCNTQCAARMSLHAHKLWAHMSLGLNDSARRQWLVAMGATRQQGTGERAAADALACASPGAGGLGAAAARSHGQHSLFTVGCPQDTAAGLPSAATKGPPRPPGQSGRHSSDARRRHKAREGLPKCRAVDYFSSHFPHLASLGRTTRPAERGAAARRCSIQTGALTGLASGKGWFYNLLKSTRIAR